MRYTYICGPDENELLAYCIESVGDSARFFSELHQSTMVGTVIWVQHRTITVEVEACE